MAGKSVKEILDDETSEMSAWGQSVLFSVLRANEPKVPESILRQRSNQIARDLVQESLSVARVLLATNVNAGVVAEALMTLRRQYALQILNRGLQLLLIPGPPTGVN